ncbi:hypothetical protein BN1221_01733 [Brenneria goodwinii]|uniref:Uncharacterized protein n=1 Tax=Brenneria goodwinii TaxID=1109412 RepID=A0A0G4JTM9_9GAMM|nr:hypothetical protein BN1221_01733 [Brenneria goodwinii]
MAVNRDDFSALSAAARRRDGNHANLRWHHAERVPRSLW